MKRGPLEIIREATPQEEMLCQLAEEAAELAQAALKLRRVYDGTSPTPIKRAAAYDALLEEIADVNNCLTVLGLDGSMARVRTSMLATEKLHRWADRLEADETGRV